MPKRPRRPESPLRAQAHPPAGGRPVSACASAWIARTVLAAAALPAQSAHRTAHGSAHAATPKVEVAPGTLVRWAAPGTKHCSMAGRSWKAMDDACYSPLDVLHQPATVAVTGSNG